MLCILITSNIRLPGLALMLAVPRPVAASIIALFLARARAPVKKAGVLPIPAKITAVVFFVSSRLLSMARAQVGVLLLLLRIKCI